MFDVFENKTFQHFKYALSLKGQTIREDGYATLPVRRERSEYSLRKGHEAGIHYFSILQPPSLHLHCTPFSVPTHVSGMRSWRQLFSIDMNISAKRGDKMSMGHKTTYLQKVAELPATRRLSWD